MKAASSSECSSGCESGWTTYLDQISNSDPYGRGLYGEYEEKAYAMYEEDEEEDLSMVSDASSAPQPNSLPYYYYGYASNEDSNTKTKTTTTTTTRKKKKEAKQQQSLCLDDTASSSIFHFSHSQENVRRTDDHNSAEQVYSAAPFQGESVTKKRMSFFKSSTKGKSGNLLGRKKQ